MTGEELYHMIAPPLFVGWAHAAPELKENCEKAAAKLEPLPVKSRGQLFYEAYRSDAPNAFWNDLSPHIQNKYQMRALHYDLAVDELS